MTIKEMLKIILAISREHPGALVVVGTLLAIGGMLAIIWVLNKLDKKEEKEK